MEKYRNPQKTGASEDPNKGAKERFKPDEGRWQDRRPKENTVEINVENLFQIEPEKKDALIDKLIKLESEYLEIDPPKFMYYSYNGPKTQYGFYNGNSSIRKFADGSTLDLEKDTIYINTAFSRRSQQQVIGTIIHELRHAYQSRVQKSQYERSEISEATRQYLQYSRENYKKDDDNGDYPINGLETDARVFADARAELYMQYTTDDILALEKAPVQVAKNQILMGAGDILPNGRIAPITVSVTFAESNLKKFSSERKLDNKGGNFSMAINEGTDFSEAAQEKAAAKYGEVIESIQTFSESVVTQFIERVKGHPYKQLEEAGNVFIRSYNEELPRKVKEAIRSWCQSENSFASSIAKQYDDNEESKSAALKVEKGIEDKVDTCFKNIAEIKINKPISVNAEAIISDAQYMEGLSKELKKEKEMWMGVFQKLGEQQNSLYSNMEELVAETFNKTEEEYQAVYKDIMNVSEEFKAARAAVIKSANTKASNVKDNIQNIVDQYTRRRKNKH